MQYADRVVLIIPPNIVRVFPTLAKSLDAVLRIGGPRPCPEFHHVPLKKAATWSEVERKELVRLVDAGVVKSIPEHQEEFIRKVLLGLPTTVLVTVDGKTAVTDQEDGEKPAAETEEKPAAGKETEPAPEKDIIKVKILATFAQKLREWGYPCSTSTFKRWNRMKPCPCRKEGRYYVSTEAQLRTWGDQMQGHSSKK